MGRAPTPLQARRPKLVSLLKRVGWVTIVLLLQSWGHLSFSSIAKVRLRLSSSLSAEVALLLLLERGGCSPPPWARLFILLECGCSALVLLLEIVGRVALLLLLERGARVTLILLLERKGPPLSSSEAVPFLLLERDSSSFSSVEVIRSSSSIMRPWTCIVPNTIARMASHNRRS